MIRKRNVQLTLAVRIAILAGAMCTIACDMVVVPILDLLYGAFPDSSPTVVAMAYTISGIAFIPASLATPRLCRKFSMRPLMLTGTLLCILGGGFGGSIHNLAYVIGMHFVEGIGAGICTNLIPIYIARLCREEQDILRMESLNGVVGTSSGLIATLLSGLAAARLGWQAAYLVYFLEIIIFLLQLFFLPDTVPEESPEKENPGQKNSFLNKRTGRWLAEVFAFALLINIMWTNQAEYLAESGLGSADIAGFASGCIQLGGMLSGFCMAWVMRRARNYHQNVCYFLFICALGLMLLSTKALHFYAASFIWGTGQGLIYPYMWAQATLIAPPGQAAGLISWTTVAWYLAVGTTTLCYRPVALLFGNDTSTFALTFTLRAFVLLFLYRLVMSLWERKRNIV